MPLPRIGPTNLLQESGFYRVQFSNKSIPVEMLGYALTKRFSEQDGRNGNVSISINDASNTPNSPGKVFCLRAESVFELALKAESLLPKGGLMFPDSLAVDISISEHGRQNNG